MEKTKKQLSNTQHQKRRKLKKIRRRNKGKTNYFERTLKIINNLGIKKQILKVTKKRNSIKRGILPPHP
ncbi:MAG: hypothetical protein WC531_00825 [Candidatus Paceibacterota bacterium]|jgi:hypothetical protein